MGTSTAPASDPFDTRINFKEIPISALRQKSRKMLSVYLNPIKILPSQDGLSRDWRGIFYLCGLQNQQYLQYLSSQPDSVGELLDTWERESMAVESGGGDGELTASIDRLQQFMSLIDRFDCLDDMSEYFTEDAIEYMKNKAKKIRLEASNGQKQERSYVDDDALDGNENSNLLTVDDLRLAEEGLPPQQYDAFVVFAEEDINFATKMIEEMENRDLKLCVKERDLLSCHNFELDTIRRVLTDRCNRVVVILSPAFVLSPLNEFIVNLAQSLAITQRKHKLIPCLFESCEVPEIFRHMHLLNYPRSLNLYNYWDKLYKSVVPAPVGKSIAGGGRMMNGSASGTLPTISVCDFDQPAKKAVTTPTATCNQLLPPTPKDGALISSFLQLSPQLHGGSAPSLERRGTDGTDGEVRPQPRIFPPEPRRRSATSMLNINLISETCAADAATDDVVDADAINGTNSVSELNNNNNYRNVSAAIDQCGEELFESLASTSQVAQRKKYKWFEIDKILKKKFRLSESDAMGCDGSFGDGIKPPKKQKSKSFFSSFKLSDHHRQQQQQQGEDGEIVKKKQKKKSKKKCLSVG